MDRGCQERHWVGRRRGIAGRRRRLQSTRESRCYLGIRARRRSMRSLATGNVLRTACQRKLIAQTGPMRRSKRAGFGFFDVPTSVARSSRRAGDLFALSGTREPAVLGHDCAPWPRSTVQHRREREAYDPVSSCRQCDYYLQGSPSKPNGKHDVKVTGLRLDRRDAVSIGRFGGSVWRRRT